MVMMRHLQDNHSNQIFISSSSDDLSLPAGVEWQWSRMSAGKQGCQLDKDRNPPLVWHNRALLPHHCHALPSVAAYLFKGIGSLPRCEKRESNLFQD